MATQKINLKHSADDDKNFDAAQLKLGTEIELEHTNSRKIAKSIAKAHLAEIPDYYTRLAKMEKSAKKENKNAKKK